MSGIKRSPGTVPSVLSHRRRASASPRQTRCHGPADTGLGVRAAATALDLDFISAAWEEFDLILSGSMLAAAEPLIAAIRESSRRWQHLAVTT